MDYVEFFFTAILIYKSIDTAETKKHGVSFHPVDSKSAMTA